MNKNNLDLKKIKERLKVVCICKGIKMGRVLDALERFSCKTKEDLNKHSGCGSGDCKGTRCGPVIEDILSNDR